jgi:hypothetical protein
MKKQEKRPQFVRLSFELLDSPAWRAMSPAGQCLYPLVKRQYNGSNNGRVFLSHRAAATATGLTRPTVAKAYAELMRYGFLVMTTPGCLGSEGHGKAPHWRLTEEATADRPATKDYLSWDETKPIASPRKTKPRPKFFTTLAN